MHGGRELNQTDIIHEKSGQNHKNVQWISNESQADRPWEKTWSSCMETAWECVVRGSYEAHQCAHNSGSSSHGAHCKLAHVRGVSLVDRSWVGECGESFPSGSTPDPSTPHQSLVLVLWQTGPGRSLPQRQSRSQAAA